jgi:hypothetical protein
MADWYIHLREGTRHRFSPVYAIVVFPKIRWKAELSIHVVKYMCMFKGVQLKSRLNALEPDWPQCGCPAACVISHHFFGHPCLIALSFQQGKIWHALKKCYYFSFLILFSKNCISWRVSEHNNMLTRVK